MVREGLRLILEAQPNIWVIGEAANGHEAVRLMSLRCPDVLVMDVLMPGIDGFELVRRLRADPAIAQTRVIFYTATYMEAEVRVLAEACGVKDVLVKPTEPHSIISTVQAALGRQAPTQSSVATEQFDHEHRHLLLNKLAQKVYELEALNNELEQRVQARTQELDNANRQLIELNRVKDDILAITSHDLRSPLSAIQNMAELLLEDDPDTSEQARRELTRNISATARRLIELVTKMLDLTRLEAGKVELELLELRASDVAQQTLETLRISASAKNITTQLVVEPGELPLRADWLRLSQVFNNLLSNAIKFTPPGGQITLTVEPEVSRMRVSIADTGLGIPREEIPYVFEKFKQVHTHGTAKEIGTGLGLAIVRQLVELHHGSIEVFSEWQRGSTFVIHLPALYTQKVQRNNSESQESAARSQH